MLPPLTFNLCLTAVPNYSQEVQAPYHFFLWQCAFLMFLKLISQRKAWSLQNCWVPYKHWGNVYIICAKKNSTDKTRGVQSSDSEKPLGNYLHLLILLYTQKHALQLCGRCIIQCNTGSTSTSTRFLSSTVEQQINDTHFAVALGANTQQKCPKKIFLLSK